MTCVITFHVIRTVTYGGTSGRRSEFLKLLKEISITG